MHRLIMGFGAELMFRALRLSFLSHTHLLAIKAHALLKLLPLQESKYLPDQGLTLVVFGARSKCALVLF